MKQYDVVAIGFIIFKKRAGEIELLSVSDSIRERGRFYFISDIYLGESHRR